MTDTHKAALVAAETQAVQRTHPMVSAAIEAVRNGRGDVETLQKFLDLQRDWEAGEAEKAFTRALVALKRDLPTVIQKDSTVDFTSKSGQRTYYKHASLAGVMDAITEPLHRHGFSLNYTTSTGDRLVRVTCRLTHTEGHHEETTLEAPADTSGNKNPAQAVMSTITLLQRYTALALLGIATADMPEPGPSAAEPPPPEGIDAKQNLRAVDAITKAGLRQEDAEALVGRPVSEWTNADRSQVRAWFNQKRAVRAVVAAPDSEAFLAAVKANAEALDACPSEDWLAVEERAKALGLDPREVDETLRGAAA